MADKENIDVALSADMSPSSKESITMSPETPSKPSVASKSPAVKHSSTATSTTAAAAARRTGATGSTASSRASVGGAAGTRNAGGLSKPPTRPPASSATSTTRRPTTATSATSSHRSRTSVSASEDEKKSSLTSAAARRTATTTSSPRTTAATSGAARKPTTSTSTTAGARTPTLSSRTSNAGATTSARSAAAAARPGTLPASSSKGLSANGTALGGAGRGVAPSAKEVEELKTKLADGDSQIETLNAQIQVAESTISELRTQLASAPSVPDSAQIEHAEEALISLKAEYEAAIAKLESRLSEVTEKLETELEQHKTSVNDAESAKAAAASEIGELQKALETVRLESEGEAKASGTALQKALDDGAAKLADLQASLTDKHQTAIDELEARHKAELERGQTDVSVHESTVAELKSAQESLVTELQNKIAELTASHAALEASVEDKSRSTEQTHNDKIAALEGEISQLKALNETSGRSADDANAQLTELKNSLADKDNELAKAKEDATTLLDKLTEIQTLLADRDGEISKLKAMHDERMKNLSQDYENEIESLRGDAFFKRKFEELEGQHDELKASAEEAAKAHADALAAAKAEYGVAIQSLQAMEEAHAKNLDALGASHAEELLKAKTGASADKDAHQSQLDSLKAQHAEELGVLKRESEAILEKELEALKASHFGILEALKQEHLDERTKAEASHDEDLVAAKSAGSDAHAGEIARVQAELEAAKDKLEQTEADHAITLETAKIELQTKHMEEIEKLMDWKTEAMEKMKSDNEQARKELEDLTAAHSKSIEDTIAEYKSTSSSLEDALDQQKAANADLERTLTATKEALEKAQTELEELGQHLAQEKMERMTALADLDAAKIAKPDTSEADSLRKELAALKQSHEQALAAVHQDLKAKEEDLEAQKVQFVSAQGTLTGMKDDLDLAQRELEAHRAAADAKHKTALADYKDLNDSMTVLIEEASNKAKELEVKLDRAIQHAEESERRTQEAEAQLKVKEAELAEFKANAAAQTKGLTNGSKDVGKVAGMDGDGGEGEDEDTDGIDDDHSSAALASLSKARSTAKQIDALDRDMRDRNLQLLNSITNAHLST